MNWFNKMERKFGKYAIPNLPLIIVIIYGFGFLMNLVKPEWIYFITLNPEAIIHGQVWRLVSWIFVPDSASNVFFVLIFLFFYYSIGKNLEIAWGKFAFNFFFFMGIFLTIIGAISKAITRCQWERVVPRRWEVHGFTMSCRSVLEHII